MLNREEILAMEAGDRLDAQVAETVMGMQGWFEYSFGSVPDAEPYSTDISAAWQVVEKLMKTEGYQLALYSPQALINDEFGIFSEGWSVFFTGWSNPNIPTEAFAEFKGGRTAPEAICKAALIAKLEVGGE